jgi:protein arginine N-methyltransferase 1
VGEYPIYDEAIYEVLRRDERRNGLFRRAIRAAAPGTVVLEVGCGPDLLWTREAAAAGASRLYAVEVIPDTARLAEQAAARACLDRRVRVMAGDSTRIELPERADLCIAEIVGCIGGAEGIAAVLADAWHRHLARSATVIPAAVRTLTGAVSLLDLTDGDMAMPEEFVPYVHAVFHQADGPFDLRLYIGGASPSALMSTADQLEHLDLAGQSYAQGGHLRLKITANGQIDGLLAWIELAVGADGEVLDSLAEDTNWLPVYIPFMSREPLAVSTGDVLSLEVKVIAAVDGIHPEYFFDGHLVRAGSGAVVPLTAESRYRGGPFRSTVVHQRLFQAAAGLPEGRGVARRPLGEGPGRAAEEPADVGADALLVGGRRAENVEGGRHDRLWQEAEHLLPRLRAAQLGEANRLPECVRDRGGLPPGRDRFRAGERVNAARVTGLKQRDGGDGGDVGRVNGRQGDIAERRGDHPSRTDRAGPAERVGVEVPRPQHGPFQARPLDGRFQVRRVAPRANPLGGQQHDPADAGRLDDVHDRTEVTPRHEVRWGQQKHRGRSGQNRLEAFRLSHVGLVTEDTRRHLGTPSGDRRHLLARPGEGRHQRPADIPGSTRNHDHVRSLFQLRMPTSATLLSRGQ